MNKNRQAIITLLCTVTILAGLCLTCCTQQQKTSGASVTQVDEPHFATFASMAPSNTELIYSLDAKNQLVGVCTQCDVPDEVKEKPRVGTFTSVDLEKLTMLRPQGVLLVNGQESIANTLKSHGVSSVILSNNSVHDISANIKRLGRITHKLALANLLSSEFEKQVDTVKNALAAAHAKKPRVFFGVWVQPLVTVGLKSYLNDAIDICGGINIANRVVGEYPHFSVETLVVEQPDVIILPHEADTADFLSKAPWNSLKAVKQHRVYFLPPQDNDYLSRPTLRLIKGLYWLESCIHPEIKLR